MTQLSAHPLPLLMPDMPDSGPPGVGGADTTRAWSARGQQTAASDLLNEPGPYNGTTAPPMGGSVRGDGGHPLHWVV